MISLFGPDLGAVRRRRRVTQKLPCTSWSGHRFQETETGDLHCPQCGTTRPVDTAGLGVDICLSWHGHRFVATRAGKAIFCPTCGENRCVSA